MTAVPRIIAGNTASDYPEEGISKKRHKKIPHSQETGKQHMK